MNNVRSPLAYEFETADAEANYDAWLRTKVAASVADSSPLIPHDEVERRMAERLTALKAKHSAD
ncbi:stability determinant [Xanthomonas theicola]|uniref:Stability determinant n=1 Tax=Xanthomonas theicola TaxID=56464 RepID=A0A2S6Z6A7_9XANT|nr:stability determinant [Xanthomonas theicola]PPT76864.1 stability determinant [Xanthomonas theicola]QNH24715.1 stability determinant [Xanthomonas theicola]